VISVITYAIDFAILGGDLEIVELSIQRLTTPSSRLLAVLFIKARQWHDVALTQFQLQMPFLKTKLFFE